MSTEPPSNDTPNYPRSSTPAGETKPDDTQKSVGPPAASDKEVQSKSRDNQQPRLQGPDERKSLHHRRHYRIVFEEVAIPLYTIRNLPDVFLVLRDAAKVLAWIHGIEWVHRDISGGNLYLFGNRGLIGDLEYAKRKNDDSKHEMRTGTLDFMAVEAIQGGYNYLGAESDEYDRQLGMLKQGRHDEVVAETSAISVVPFFYNDLHDLESLWWAAIWHLFFYRDMSQNQVNPSNEELRKVFTQRLFPRSLWLGDRNKFFQSKFDFFEGVKWFPESFARIKVTLNVLRAGLRVFYIRFEALFPEIRYDVFVGLHETFQTQFETCRQLSSNIELIPYKTTGQRRVGSETQPSDPRNAFPRASVAPAPSSKDSAPASLLGKRKLDDEERILVPQPLLTDPRAELGMTKIVVGE